MLRRFGMPRSCLRALACQPYERAVVYATDGHGLGVVKLLTAFDPRRQSRMPEVASPSQSPARRLLDSRWGRSWVTAWR